MKFLKIMIFTGFFVLFPIVGQNVVFAEYTKTFRISAYYSPLPCQEKYATGTYEGDIRLNGRGTNGADGTQVYPGMIAAPKTFAFGTKLYIPGFGTGTVHDRGGAIVSSNGTDGSFDRLDIWMGFGDEGLRRALNFGKRNLDVTVYGVDNSIADNVTIPGFTWDEKHSTCDGNMSTVATSQESPVLISSISTPKVSENTYGVEKDGLFYQGLMKGDVNSDVSRLQRELTNLNFYKGKITGSFDDLTAHALFKFQQSQGIVSSKSDVGAGYFGPTTRNRLNEIISLRNQNNILIASKNQNLLAVK
ncbi:MAG: peptidoglycan-binding protein [Candidatus Gracilibacteria bacterium]|nr:peptidoglycan-binding protein [Candidatus Gracilibacteria bacterium]